MTTNVVILKIAIAAYFLVVSLLVSLVMVGKAGDKIIFEKDYISGVLHIMLGIIFAYTACLMIGIIY